MSLGEYIKTPNTIGLWHFNGNANDDSGNGLNGSNVGTVIYSKSNGKFNEGAGGFFTNSSYISIADNNLLDLTTFTISVFVKITVFKGVIYAKFRSAYVDGNYYLDTAGRSNRLRFLYASNGTQTNLTINKSLSSGVWYNVIVTAGGGNIKAYINAELISTSTYTGTIATNAHPLTIGTRATDYSYNYLDGNIDELIIENVIWDQTQIQKYYTQSLGRYATP